MRPGDSERAHLASVAASFDERAPTYDASAMHRELADAVAGFARPDGGGSVLDVATGTGLVLRAFAGQATRARLIGVDVSAGMLRVARRELPRATFVQARAEQLPFRDGTIELATCVTAMHLMSRPDAVFAELARVLAPGGRLVLATFQVRPDQSLDDRPYRTNHRAFETPELMAVATAPAGLAVRRSSVVRCDADTCLLTELSR